MSRFHPAVYLATILIGCAFPSATYSQQFAQAEVSEILFGIGGPTVLSSSASGAFDLTVGTTGLESFVGVNPVPPNDTLAGTFAQLFVQANSFDALGSSANALYVYEFSVPSGAEELFINYNPIVNTNSMGNVGTSSFRLTQGQTDIFSATDQPLSIAGGLLSPGDYVLTLEAEAIASNIQNFGFASAQAQVAIDFVAVPEPSSFPIFIIAAAALTLRYRPEYLCPANCSD